MGYLTAGECLENMLQLKRFDLYFARIMIRQWLYFHIEIMVSATDAIGSSGAHAPREIFEMIDAIWCVLMNYFDQIKS